MKSFLEIVEPLFELFKYFHRLATAQLIISGEKALPAIIVQIKYGNPINDYLGKTTAQMRLWPTNGKCEICPLHKLGISTNYNFNLPTPSIERARLN